MARTAADLLEDAALRDEVKRLQAMELAISDDPMARDVEAVLQESGEGGTFAAPADLIARAIDDWTREKLAGPEDDGEIHGQLEAIVEAALLRRTLREVRGNQLEAARRLGINRNTLRKKLLQYGLAD